MLCGLREGQNLRRRDSSAGHLPRLQLGEGSHNPYPSTAPGPCPCLSSSHPQGTVGASHPQAGDGPPGGVVLTKLGVVVSFLHLVCVDAGGYWGLFIVAGVGVVATHMAHRFIAGEWWPIHCWVVVKVMAIH